MPVNYAYQITVLRVSNTTAAPITLIVYRVPSGGAVAAGTTIVPIISVPVASNTQLAVDLTPAWGSVLRFGDSIWAIAGGAGLVIWGDGLVIQ